MVMSRHISELSANPRRPLTQDQLDHFEEYLTFKNDDISAKGVSLTEAVDDVLADIDHYLGVPEANCIHAIN